MHRLLDPRGARRALKLHRHPHVLRLGRHAHHAKPQRVGAEGLDHVERIDAVALALAHRLAVAVENLGMDGDVAKRNLPRIKKPHDHHPRDPERDDVTAGDERGGGIEAVELRRLCRPAERGVRPERRGEPGIERVGITDERFSRHGICAERLVRRADMPAAAAVGLPRHGRPARERLLKIGIRHALDVPDRDPMAPPELPAHRPVAFLAEPIEIALRIALGHDADVS